MYKETIKSSQEYNRWIRNQYENVLEMEFNPNKVSQPERYPCVVTYHLLYTYKDVQDRIPTEKHLIYHFVYLNDFK